MKKVISFFFSFSFIVVLFAQNDTDCNFRISLLTCSPGHELYSTFGHSAIRIQNAAAGTDIIFNYGTFDFDDPSFYSKFTRGKLLYFVSIDKFEGFLGEYEYEQRGIIEQVLNLSCAQKEKLLAALQENAKEENKYYKYDFIEDNCTTRLRDIVFRNADNPIVTKNILATKGITFRNLIHEYLDKSYQYWSKLGIDILLGSPLDRKVTNNEAMFLPDYLLKGFDSTNTSGKPLVAGKMEVLKPVLVQNKRPVLSPFVIFTVLLLAIASLSFFRSAKRFLSILDFILFFISGVLGVLLLFMWFGTDHPECRNNYNLVWAFPLHFVIAFFIYQKRTWVKFYFLANFILLLLFLFSWKWLPQELNMGLIPIVCLLLLRSYVRYKS